MEGKKPGRRSGSKNYTREFREEVVAETNDPKRSIADVARARGLNANLIAQWRRKSLEEQRAALTPCVELLPVDVIDLPVDTSVSHIPLRDREMPGSVAQESNCEIEVEVGKRRIRIRGVSQAFAEQILRDCLK